MSDADRTPIEEMSFEDAMRELEEVVRRLEGDVALEESIALYERGSKLRARCAAKLKEAEQKVATLTLDANGEPTGTRPFAVE